MRIINPRLDYAGLQIQRDKRDKIKKPAQQGSIINLLSMQKAYFYGFRPKNVRSPNQKHTVSEPKPYVFGTETVKGKAAKKQINQQKDQT